MKIQQMELGNEWYDQFVMLIFYFGPIGFCLTTNHGKYGCKLTRGLEPGYCGVIIFLLLLKSP